MIRLAQLHRSLVRRLFVVVSLLAVIAAPGLSAQAALAYSTCSDTQLKVGSRWLVPLWDGDCARFAGTMRLSSEVLSDGSRAERFEVPLLDASCLQATITSTDFAPDVYVYDDANFRHEVGSWQRRGNQASSVVELSNGLSAASIGDDVPVLYVLATSFGPGAQFGDYTLDLRTC